MVKELKYADFKKFISSTKPVIVDFWATWCAHCKMIAPIVEQLSKEYEGKLSFGKISVGDYPQLSNEIGIVEIPCLVVFKNGKEVDRITGLNSAAALKSKIDKILMKN